jgi:hypothetical protein
MNPNLIIKILVLLFALVFHKLNFGFDFFEVNWMIIAICYLAITNDKYSILPFFLIGLAVDLLDSEILGFTISTQI